MNTLVVMPILTHLTASVLCILCWGRVRTQRAINISAVVASLGFSIALLATHASGDVASPVYSGGWAAPFNITFVVDLFSAIMLTLTATVGLFCVIYSLGNIDERRERFGYHALVQALLAACCGAFTTGDLFNMFVWFEIMLISSFVLLTLGGERGQLEGAIKYVTLNLISSTVFLVGVGLLYALVGTLNIADMSVRLQTVEDRTTVSVIGVLFIIAYGIKAGLFPLFFWLPASYHTPPAAVSALFGGLLTKVGVYAIARVFGTVFVGDHAFTGQILLWMAAGTMVSGSLAAFAQAEIRRALSFQLIASIGYIMMGIAVWMIAGERADRTTGAESDALRAASLLGLTGAIVYIAHHMLVKTNLFLLAGLVRRIGGHGELKRLGGMYKAHPGLAALFFINALSIAGMPLLSGFWAKMALIRAGLETGAYVVVAASLVASLAGLAGMMKIWMEVFWKDRPESGRAAREPSAASAGAVAPPITTGRYRIPLMTTPAVVLTVITVTLGLAPGWLYGLSERAARQLSDREGYITAVLPPDYLDETRAQIAAIRAEREAFALASETAAQTADLAEEAAR